jgi:BTB/POZ domain
MFEGPISSARDSQGRVFIDRDGSLFSIILQWLRARYIPSTLSGAQLEALRCETDFFQLGGLTAEITTIMAADELSKSKGNTTLLYKIVEERHLGDKKMGMDVADKLR